MKAVSLKNKERELIAKCWIADSYLSRLVGLMGRRTLPDDEGICFPHCNSVHTCFMRFPIDVVSVDAKGSVVDIVSPMPSWRFMLPRKGAKHIIELRAHRAKDLGIQVGTQLFCEGAWG